MGMHDAVGPDSFALQSQLAMKLQNGSITVGRSAMHTFWPNGLHSGTARMLQRAHTPGWHARTESNAAAKAVLGNS